MQNGLQGAQKWPTGSGKGSNPRLVGALNNFPKKFFDPSTSSMRKGCDGDKIEKWNVEKTVKIADHYRCCQATT